MVKSDNTGGNIDMDNQIQIPGFPEWTQNKVVHGLDPLGMHRPNEAIYQTLLPGMTTITERYRYYSFFCWLLHKYPSQELKTTTNLDKFRNFQKRAEGLYALVCKHVNDEYGKNELGVAGSEWADRMLSRIRSNTVDFIDFIEDDDPLSIFPVRHLQSKAGAFGGRYITQMVEMGMVGTNDLKLKKIPFCTDAAIELAEGFSHVLGNNENAFLNAIHTGIVTNELLNNLSSIRLSEIQENSVEHQMLTSFLMQDNKADKNNLNRRRTLKMLLKLIDFLGIVPSEDNIRWTWFGSGINEGYESDDNEQQEKWKVFQMNDLIRLCYQFLLKLGVQVLKDSGYTSISLNEMVEEMVNKLQLPKQTTVDSWLNEKNNDKVESCIKEAYEDMFRDAKEKNYYMSSRSALFIIFAVISITKESYCNMFKIFSTKKEFQSLKTEYNFINEQLTQKKLVEIATELIRERIIKRHILVATRKLRHQKSYTFLFEPDDYGLRFRENFDISTSSPRLKQALVFLRDIKLID